MRLYIDDWNDSNFDDKYFMKIGGLNHAQKQIESERYHYSYFIIIV